ncbi:MAG: LysE family translocator, partial [Geminicoccaceae bacterium]
MSDLALLLSMTAVHWLAMASPGPNVLVVTQTAMQHTRRHGLATALGIAGAGLIWSSAVVLGLSALLGVLPWLYGAIKLVGACGTTADPSRR